MFSPKTPTEEEKFSFDFAGLLAVGETLTGTPTVTSHVIRGTDPSPGSMISGTATISGTKVTQKIIGGVEGVIYCIKCQVDTSAAQKLELTGDLLVREPC